MIGFQDPVQEHQAAPLSRQAQPLLAQLLALAFARPFLLLGLAARHPVGGAAGGESAVQADSIGVSP